MEEQNDIQDTSVLESDSIETPVPTPTPSPITSERKVDTSEELIQEVTNEIKSTLNYESDYSPYRDDNFVNLRDKDGHKYEVHSDELEFALSNGYHLETEQEVEIDKRADEWSWYEVLAAQFVDEAAMGIPEIINDVSADALDVAAWKKAKEKNWMSNSIGGIAGFGASFLYGGALGKAGTSLAGKGATKLLGKEVVEKVAEGAISGIAVKGAKEAVENIAFASPRLLVEATLKDPELSAENLMLDGAIGFAFGAFAPAASKAFKGTKDVLKKTTAGMGEIPALGKVLKDQAATSSLGLQKTQLKKLQKSTSNLDDKLDSVYATAKQSGLLGTIKSLKKKELILNQQLNDVGSRIGNVYESLDDIFRNFRVPKGDPNLKAVAPINQLSKSADETISITFNPGFILDSVVENNPFFEEVIKKVRKSSKVKPYLKKDLTIKELWEFNRGYRQILEKGKKDFLGDLPSYYELQNVFRKEIDNMIVQFQDKLPVSTFEEWKHLNQTYSNLKIIQMGIDNKVAQKGNNFFGLTDTIAGVGGLSTFGIGGAAVAAATSNTLKRIGPDVSFTSLEVIERKMAKVASALEPLKKVQSFAKPILEKANKIVPKALSAYTKTEDENEQFDILTEKVSELAMKPEKLAEKTAEFKGNADLFEIDDALTEKLFNAIQYLNREMPKKESVNPFKKKSAINAKQKRNFLKKAEVVLNPLVVVDKIRNGTISDTEVESLREVYPRLYAAIERRLVTAVHNSEDDVDYKTRLKLRRFFPSPELEYQSVRKLQSIYQQTATPDRRGVDYNPSRIRNKIVDQTMSETQKKGLL